MAQQEALVPIGDVARETGLGRNKIDRIITRYRIKYVAREVGGRGRHPKTGPRRLPGESVQKIWLVAALEEDVLFTVKEIKSLLKKMNVKDFVSLLRSHPFPTLLEELRKKKVNIDKTPHLDRLLTPGQAK